MQFKFRKFHFLEVNEVIEVIASLEVNDVTWCWFFSSFFFCYLSFQRIVDNFVNSDNFERSDNFRKIIDAVKALIDNKR